MNLKDLSPTLISNLDACFIYGMNIPYGMSKICLLYCFSQMQVINGYKKFKAATNGLHSMTRLKG